MRKALLISSLLSLFACGEGTADLEGDENSVVPEEGAAGEVEQGLATCTLDTTSETNEVNRIAYVRGLSGLPRQPVASGVRAIARQWALTMCQQNKLYHSSNLLARIAYASGRWPTWAAENVGVGYDEAALFQAFWNSSGHRANILNRQTNGVLGVGAYRQGGTGKLFVTQNFARF